MRMPRGSLACLISQPTTDVIYLGRDLPPGGALDIGRSGLNTGSPLALGQVHILICRRASDVLLATVRAPKAMPEFADEADQAGPLFDWYSNGGAELTEGFGRVSQASAEYVRPVWASIGSTVIGPHLFGPANGGEGTPPSDEHVRWSRNARRYPPFPVGDASQHSHGTRTRSAYGAEVCRR
jgi:hypothetical protein